MTRDQEGIGSDVDRVVFVATLLIILAVSLPMMLDQETGTRAVDAAFEFVTGHFGVVYVWAAVANLAFLAWVAFGRYGRLRLSPHGELPDFSNFSWAAMLFCGGIGTGILYWGTIEWAYYYDSPPFGIAPRSPEAAEWATTYPIFHWGLTGWTFYTMPAVTLAYAYFRRGIPSLRLSDNCRPVLGAHADGVAGKVIDLIFMFGLLGAAGTGIGLAVSLIAAGVSRLTGIPDGFGLQFAIVLAVTALYATSAYVGLERGIKRLSHFNIVITFILLGFVLVAGPTVFMLRTGTNSLGLMAQNFLRMNSWTDPVRDSGFVETWTVFYWAWWIALGPFMGMFVARISKGRTLRELVFGVLGYGAFGCAVFFVILGNYALHLELEGILSVTSVLKERGAPQAIVSVIASLPWGTAVLALFCLLSMVFMATTYDSAAYTLALGATRRLVMDQHPPRWHRLFWAMIISVLPVTLMFLGGLKSFQTAAIVVSLPLIAVFVLMAVSFVRSLREEDGSHEG